VSKHKGSDAGEFKASAGKFFQDEERDTGLQTTQDARFYQISANFDKSFSNKGKDLVFQFTVKHEQKIDCGGGYMKLLPKIENPEDFNGDSKYYIMFGPDICGSSTKKTHYISHYNGENVLINKDVRCESDEFTHVYTLIVHPDNTYEIQIDGAEVQAGDLKEDFDFLEPKEIKDPSVSKPEDWVDEKQIVDPEDAKPDGWDDIPAQIADPDAEKPDDWDDELDGEWEAPMIDNPEYKGEWTPKMIDNPDYKGEWVHPMIANPDFKDDDSIYEFSDIGAVGLEIWQVKAGTVFGNVIVTDDIKEAEKAVEHIDGLRDAEKEQEKEKAEEERKAAEEAAAAAAEEDEANHEDDEEDAAEGAAEDADEKDEL
jgi:calreticulin